MERKKQKKKMTETQMIEQQVKISDTIKHVAINEVAEHPLNQKYFGQYKTQEHFNELTESIEKHGIFDALICTNKGVILSGHSRRLCSSRAGLKTVPVRYIEHDTTPEQELEIMVRINLDSMMVNSTLRIQIYEESIPAFRDMLKHRGINGHASAFTSHITAESIAKKFNISVSTAKNDLAIIGRNMRTEEARARKVELHKANIKQGIDDTVLNGTQVILGKVITRMETSDVKTARKIMTIINNTVKRAEKTIIKLEKEEAEIKRRWNDLANAKKKKGTK